MSADRNVSRRELFAKFLRPLNKASQRKPAGDSSPSQGKDSASPRKAVIQGRYCIAYIPSHCTRCQDECPEEGAIVFDGGFPRVVWECCTGCAICHDVCPAEKNAILLVNPPPR